MRDLAKYPQPPKVKWPWSWKHSRWGDSALSKEQIAEQARAARMLHDHFMSKPIQAQR